MNKYALREKIEFTNVRHLVEWAGEEFGHKTAYSFRTDPHDKEIKRVTFSELCDDVRALSASLTDMGCRGRHCVLAGKLSYEWIVMYYAALSIGAVLVPLDRDWSAEELAETVKRADAEFLFGDEDIKEKISYVAENTALACAPVYLCAKNEEKTVLRLIDDGREIFKNSPEKYFDAPVDPVKMSLLVFTSGTTGKGKGVMLSQNAILSDMYNAVPYIDVGERTVGVLPPHHTYGSTIMFIGHMMLGCEIYISSGLRYILKELKEQKPGHLVLVPLYLETFYRRILSTLKEQNKYDLVFRMIKVSNGMRRVGVDMRSSMFAPIRDAFGGELKMVITGGAPISPDIAYFFDAIGISVLNGYGITECSPLIAVNRSRHVVLGSVGDPIDNVSVKIDEPDSEGEGEILVRGPMVMLGYYKDENATADAFKEGYFKTGDYGRLGKDGVLYITGRKKNLIILSNGKNVYPEEIENALSSVPGVNDIIVYEGRSKRGVEHNAIVAEIYPDTEYFDKNGIEDIKLYFQSRVEEYNKKATPYKKVGMVKVRTTEFPKNTLRKIQRFKLNTTID